MANEESVQIKSDNYEQGVLEMHDEDAAFDNILRNLSMGIECAMPAVVKEYDSYTNYAIVQPLVNVVLKTKEEIERRPVKVPVHFMACGGYLLSFPLKQGDFGWIIAGDREVAPAYNKRKPTSPEDFNLHKYRFGYFLPDSLCNTYGVDKKKLVFGAQVATDGRITIDNDGNIKIKTEVEKTKENPNRGDILIETPNGNIDLKNENGVTNITAKTIGLNGDTGVSGNMVVTGDSIITGTSTVNGSLTVGGSGAFGGGLSAGKSVKSNGYFIGKGFIEGSASSPNIEDYEESHYHIIEDGILEFSLKSGLANTSDLFRFRVEISSLNLSPITLSNVLSGTHTHEITDALIVPAGEILNSYNTITVTQTNGYTFTYYGFVRFPDGLYASTTSTTANNNNLSHTHSFYFSSVRISRGRSTSSSPSNYNWETGTGLGDPLFTPPSSGEPLT